MSLWLLVANLPVQVEMLPGGDFAQENTEAGGGGRAPASQLGPAARWACGQHDTARPREATRPLPVLNRFEWVCVICKPNS